jgi:hypothetical protein
MNTTAQQKKRITCWQNPFEVDRYPLFQ